MSSIKLRAVVALSGLALVLRRARSASGGAEESSRGRRRRPQVQSKSAISAEFEKFRDIMEDASPGTVRSQGRGVVEDQEGPKNASLEQCDLGLGPGWSRRATCAHAALLRRRGSGDGCGAPHRSLHGDAAGFKAADLAKNPSAADRALPTRCRWSPTSPRSPRP